MENPPQDARDLGDTGGLSCGTPPEGAYTILSDSESWALVLQHRLWSHVPQFSSLDHEAADSFTLPGLGTHPPEAGPQQALLMPLGTDS